MRAARRARAGCVRGSRRRTSGSLRKERTSRIGESLEALPVPYREVLTLRFEEEMKLEEIAEVLGAPLSTVKTRLRRALDRLRVTMEVRFPGETWQ